MADARELLMATLGKDGAAALAPHLARAEFPDGHLLFQQGVPSSQLVLIEQGEVSVRLEANDQAVEIARRQPGAWLGEIGLIDEGPAMATVVAIGPVVAWTLSHAELVRLQTEHPTAASALLKHVTRQIAMRIATGSAGIVEEVGGHLRLRKPEEVRSWVGRVLDRLFGGEGR